MEPEFKPTVVQTNIASEQRNAGRDYCEIHEHRDLRFVLATWSAEKLDALALENSRFFQARFGFEASTIARIKVVAFQRRFDLSDTEIRFLKRAGFMRPERNGLHVETGNLLPVLGWIQVVLFVVMNLLMVATIATSSAPEWKQGIGFIVVGAIAAASLAWAYKACIAPRRLLKSCGAIDAHIGRGSDKAKAA